jgi:hypothetical protein
VQEFPVPSLPRGRQNRRKWKGVKIGRSVGRYVGRYCDSEFKTDLLP